MTNENDIKRLTEKYFTGDISPEETHSLLEAADIADGGAYDARTLADLRMIRALHSPELGQMLAPVPSGLEERLDSHISSLARRRPAMRRWLAACSAAAAVAIVMTIGLRHHGVDQTSGLASADTPSVLPDLTLTVPDTRGTVTSDPAGATPATIITPAPRRASSAPRPMAKAAQKAAPLSVPAEAPMKATLPELELSPIVTATIRDVRPILASAIVDPSDVLAQPLSTISQSIDNVYMSLDMVAKALRSTSSTLDDAADKLQIASGLRLHDI